MPLYNSTYQSILNRKQSTNLTLTKADYVVVNKRLTSKKDTYLNKVYSEAPNTKLSILTNVDISGYLNVNDEATFNDVLLTSVNGDFIKQIDASNNYPILARYKDGDLLYPSTTFLLGNGTNSRVSIQKTGLNNLNEFEVLADNINLNGDVAVLGGVDISGNTIMRNVIFNDASGSNLNLSGNAIVGNIIFNDASGSSLNLSGNAIVGTLDVSGIATFHSGIDIDDLTVNNLDVSGTAYFHNNIEVSGNAKFYNNVDVSNQLSSNYIYTKTLNMTSGNIAILPAETIAMDVSCNNLYIANNAVIENLGINTPASLTYKFIVDGNSRFNGNIYMDDATLISCDNIVISNDASCNNLYVNGNCRLMNVEVSGNLNVKNLTAGNTSHFMNVDISGTTYTYNDFYNYTTSHFVYLNCFNDAIFSSNAYIFNLDVSANATIQNLEVSGNTLIYDISGHNAYFNNVYASNFYGSFNLGSDIDISGQLRIQNTTSALNPASDVIRMVKNSNCDIFGQNTTYSYGWNIGLANKLFLSKYSSGGYSDYLTIDASGLVSIDKNLVISNRATFANSPYNSMEIYPNTSSDYKFWKVSNYSGTGNYNLEFYNGTLGYSQIVFDPSPSAGSPSIYVEAQNDCGLILNSRKDISGTNYSWVGFSSNGTIKGDITMWSDRDCLTINRYNGKALEIYGPTTIFNQGFFNNTPRFARQLCYFNWTSTLGTRALLTRDTSGAVLQTDKHSDFVFFNVAGGDYCSILYQGGTPKWFYVSISVSITYIGGYFFELELEQYDDSAGSNIKLAIQRTGTPFSGGNAVSVGSLVYLDYNDKIEFYGKLDAGTAGTYTILFDRVNISVLQAQ